jgi:hypothetical protein
MVGFLTSTSSASSRSRKVLLSKPTSGLATKPTGLADSPVIIATPSKAIRLATRASLFSALPQPRQLKDHTTISLFNIPLLQ